MESSNPYLPLVPSLTDTWLSDLFDAEVKKVESLLRNLNSELKLTPQDFKPFVENKIGKEIINHNNSPLIIPFPKALVLPKRVDISTTSVTEDLSFSAVEIKKSTNRMGFQQKEILIKVYLELEETQRDKVKSTPTQWLGNGSISDSDRANWSKSLRKLINRGLIVKSFADDNLLSKSNPGNSITYVSLTPLGAAAAKWLINNGHVE
jgi:DNA-binding MarR family transcriptional regulator